MDVLILDEEEGTTHEVVDEADVEVDLVLVEAEIVCQVIKGLMLMNPKEMSGTVLNPLIRCFRVVEDLVDLITDHFIDATRVATDQSHNQPISLKNP